LGYIFTLIYISVLLLRPQDWLAPWLTPLHPLDAVTALAVAATIYELGTGRLRVPWKLPHLQIMGALYLAVLASHAAHFYFAGFTNAFADFGKIVIVFTLIVVNCATQGRVRGVIAVVAALAAFMALDAVMQMRRGVGLTGLPPLIVHPGTPYETVRAQFVGIFGDPNDTSLFIIAALPLVFPLFPRNFRLVGGLGTNALLIIGVVATQSRGGFLALGASIGVLVRRFLKTWLFLLGACAAFLLLTTIVPARLRHVGLIDDSAMNRVSFWGAATRQFKRHPIFGVGYKKITDYIPGDRAIHNSYVQAYADLGILGYSAWFTLLAVSFIGMWRAGNLEPETEEEAWLSFASKALVSSLAGAYTAAYFLSRTYHIPLYVLLAIAASVYRLVGERVGIERLNRYIFWDCRYIWLWPGLSFLSMAFIYISIRLANLFR